MSSFVIGQLKCRCGSRKLYPTPNGKGVVCRICLRTSEVLPAQGPVGEARLGVPLEKCRECASSMEAGTETYAEGKGPFHPACAEARTKRYEGWQPSLDAAFDARRRAAEEAAGRVRHPR